MSEISNALWLVADKPMKDDDMLKQLWNPS